MSVLGTFKLSEEQWTTSLRLVTGEKKERDRFWAALGKERGFDPATVEFTRPRTFTAQTVGGTRRGRPPSSKPPAATPAPQTRSKGKQKLEVDRLRPKRTEAEGASTAPEEQHTRVVVQDEDGLVAQIDQIDCARCGRNHHGITYRRLTRSVQLAGETLTHYAWCPSTGEPILLLIRDEDDVRVPTDLARLLDEKGELVPAEEEIRA